MSRAAPSAPTLAPFAPPPIAMHPLGPRKAHLQQSGLLGDGDEVPANLWSSPVDASMLGMPSMSAGGPLPSPAPCRRESWHGIA